MARPTPRGNSPTTTVRLGERATDQWKRHADELGISKADVVRSAFDALDRDAAFRAELGATRRAREHFDRYRQTFGTRGVQLHLRNGKPLNVRAGRVVRDIPGTLVGTRTANGLRAFDLLIAGVDGEPDVAVENVRVTDADATECVLPLAAVHIAGPVPPVDGERLMEGPEGPERVVWRDGARLTFVGESVRPNRVARFA